MAVARRGNRDRTRRTGNHHARRRYRRDATIARRPLHQALRDGVDGARFDTCQAVDVATDICFQLHGALPELRAIFAVQYIRSFQHAAPWSSTHLAGEHDSVLFEL